jgi:hypothetical protein
VATCFDHGGDPQAIHLIEKSLEFTVPNNNRVVNLLHIYIYLFSFENVIMCVILFLICG